MSDSFSFGEPAKKWSVGKVRPPRQRGGTGVSVGPTVLIVLAGVVAVALIAAVMGVMKSGGEAAAQSEKSAIQQVGAADDAQAKLAAQQALTTAQMLVAEAGSLDSVTPEALSAAEPSLRYTTGASTGPTSVSVAVANGQLSVAVASGSGACVWAHQSGGSVSWGSGTACTGQAALGA